MKTTCPNCEGRRVVFEARDDFAAAVVCPDCIMQCEQCTGRGFHVTTRHGYDYVADCSCRDIEKKARLFNAAKVPALYADKLFAAIRSTNSYRVHQTQQDTQNKVLKWAKDYTPGRPGFLLEGSFGTGKTMLMCQAITTLTIQHGVSCFYIDFSLLLQEIKQKMSNKENSSDLYAMLRSSTVLAVDELGKVRGTDWELSELDMLISRRYQSAQTTMFATNFAENDLSARIGGKLSSRLAEKCEPLTVKGDDYRRQARGNF